MSNAAPFSEPLARLAAALQSQIPDTQNDLDRAHGSTSGDLALLSAVTSAPGGPARLRLWNNTPCIVVPRHVASRAGFAGASQRLESEGWPVTTRASGGTAVVHRPGVLNISMAYAESGLPIDINRGYTRFARLISDGLRRLSIDTDLDMGPVPGSFCDGKHNIRWRGRKLAGTAAIVRRHKDIAAYLVHASLTVWGDVAEDIAVIRRLETACGIDAPYDPRAHVTLAEILQAAT